METPTLHPFFLLAGLHALVLVSPGANFTVLAHNTLVHGRRPGVLIALGVTIGTGVYVSFALFGMKLLLAIAHSPRLYVALKFLGAAYLAFLGLKACLAKRKSLDGTSLSGGPMTTDEAIRIGLFSQLSNPKAMLFFLGLFTQVVDFHTPITLKIGYGAWMCLATFAWFAFVACLLSVMDVQRHLRNWLHWVSKAFGVVLILLAGMLVLSN